MSYSQITCGLADSVLTLTLNRPDQLNALTYTMGMEFLDALDRAEADDDVRVIVVTGAGRAFCGGIDLNGDADDQLGPEELSEDTYRDWGGLYALKMYDMKKPLIAAVNGASVGGGLDIILPMDIRLVAAGAKLAFPFTRRGLMVESCASWFLPRIVGITRAMDWIIKGRFFSAEEALVANLVNEVLPAEEILPGAQEIAREIVRNTSPVSVALNRQMLWKALGAAHPMDAHRIESRAVCTVLGRGDDAREGMAAFLEKRLPDFPMNVSKDMPDFYPWWQERPFGEG